MKKKILAMLLVAAMACAALAGCGGGSNDGANDGGAAVVDVAAEKGLTGDFDPNPDYDEWTLTEYTIEDANATFVVTVSRKSDKSKYELHCNFYGDEQLVVVENGEVKEDKTGFMKTDSPLIIEQAESEGIWSAIQ